MRIIDLKDVPGMSSAVPNGMDSVSRGLVKIGFDFRYIDPDSGELASHFSPHCTKHLAMNRMSKDGIYRCPTCHVGCYLVDN